jgi:hypothetical protein
VAELVVAPFLEPLEDRVEPLVRMLLQLPVDGDVAGVADLLRQVGRVVDEFRPEVGVLLGLGRKPMLTPMLNSFSASLMKPAWRLSSRLISPKSSQISLFLPRRFISL